MVYLSHEDSRSGPPKASCKAGSRFQVSGVFCPEIVGCRLKLAKVDGSPAKQTRFFKP